MGVLIGSLFAVLYYAGYGLSLPKFDRITASVLGYIIDDMHK